MDSIEMLIHHLRTGGIDCGRPMHVRGYDLIPCVFLSAIGGARNLAPQLHAFETALLNTGFTVQLANGIIQGTDKDYRVQYSPSAGAFYYVHY